MCSAYYIYDRGKFILAFHNNCRLIIGKIFLLTLIFIVLPPARTMAPPNTTRTSSTQSAKRGGGSPVLTADVVAKNDAPPSTKNAKLVNESGSMMLDSDPNSLSKEALIQWYYFGCHWAKTLTRAGRKLKDENDALKKRVRELEAEKESINNSVTRRTDLDKLNRFQDKYLKKRITPQNIRPILGQIGFPSKFVS
jgi:hypothetical protein